MWHTDDLGGGSTLERLREWWDNTIKFGPALGYFPKPCKSLLIVKESKFDRAEEIFRDSGVNINTEGRKYLGGYVGKEEGALNYVESLMEEWMDQLRKLTQIAKS